MKNLQNSISFVLDFILTDTIDKGMWVLSTFSLELIGRARYFYIAEPLEVKRYLLQRTMSKIL